MDAVAELFEAIRTGDTENVRSLCAANSEIVNARNARGQSAVLMACYTGRKEIRDVLVENGATLELHEAAAAGNLTRVKEIVGANPELAKGYSPDGFRYWLWLRRSDMKMSRSICTAKARTSNAVATNGTAYTGLTGAVAGGHASIAQWLAENGADVNYRYAKGHSPLLEAVATVVSTLSKYLSRTERTLKRVLMTARPRWLLRKSAGTAKLPSICTNFD